MALVIGFVIGSLLSSLIIGWHHREDCGACPDLVALRAQVAEQQKQIRELTERLEARETPKVEAG